MEISILLVILQLNDHAQILDTLPSFRTLHAQLSDTQKYQIKLQNRDKMVYYSV